MINYEKLGAFYLGRPYNLDLQASDSTQPLEGPHDPRRLRRYDRQWKDRAWRNTH